VEKEAMSKTVTLGLASLDDAKGRLARAFKDEAQGAFLSFETPALLVKVLTGKRWEILQAMTGAGPLAVREVARRVGRDVKAVHGDVKALLAAGVLDRAEGGVVFPFDRVHVDFSLTTAA
jgi:predicted transcriptional regulator